MRRPAPRQPQPRPPAEQLLDQAYNLVQEKLDLGEHNAIDQLVRLIRLDRELPEEGQQGPRSVSVQWVKPQA